MSRVFSYCFILQALQIIPNADVLLELKLTILAYFLKNLLLFLKALYKINSLKKDTN